MWRAFGIIIISLSISFNGNSMSLKVSCLGKGKNTSRFIAVEVLCRWQEEFKPIEPILEHLAGYLSSVDRSLVKNMVNGVLSNMEYLDNVLGDFSKHPPRKMKPWTLMSLRLGVYQLLLLDRIPESAAVNETVKAFKVKRQPKWLVNFVNGVLRAVCRDKHNILGPEHAGANGEAILNHPQWLIDRWVKEYGVQKANAICSENNKKPPLVLRVNISLVSITVLEQGISSQGWDVQRGRYVENSLLLDSYQGSISALWGYDEGYFHIMDEAAQLAVALLGPFGEDGLYLDACAGLGGKAMCLAQELSEGSSLFAVEPEGRRFGMLGENLTRLKMSGKVEVYQGVIDDFLLENDVKYQVVLVDAPCSGTGVIRRHPDIRWSRDADEFVERQGKQVALLESASSLLAPGGILVYATCSIETEENQQVVQLFLEKNPKFNVSSALDYLPEKAKSLVNEAGFFSSTSADGIDGFFAARLLGPQ